MKFSLASQKNYFPLDVLEQIKGVFKNNSDKDTDSDMFSASLSFHFRSFPFSLFLS